MKRLIGIIAALAVLAIAAPSFAACTQAFPTSLKAEFMSGTHAAADTYKVAFYTDSATYGAATTAYAATNEVSGTGYTAGGFIIADNGVTKAAPTITTSGTVGIMDFVDLSAANITFSAASTCAVIYNSSKSNKVLGVYTFSSVQPNDGTLTVTFPAADSTNAVVRVQ